ncbi:hypothetical protein B0H13DRAFT_395383 [Mycena leptocephala]|nr:hypothetical protein B0H13DRAFT_395383 [Mycena leptocephala]
MYGYDIHGDAIMRDVSLPGPADSASLHCVDMNLALDKLIPRFSRLSLVDPPIYRVPDDLLYELFMTLVGDLPYQSCDLAVRLSHVCHDWRAIILRAPLLWRFIAMHSSGSPRDHSTTVESFLRRSQNQSITVALYIGKRPLSASTFIRILRQHASRVRALRVFASDFPSLASHLLDLSPLCFTSLEHHEALVRSDRVPGTFTAVSRFSDSENINVPSFSPLGVPTWPSRLALTALSFMYSSLKLSDFFRIVETAQSTLQHLKLYFQCRLDVLEPRPWDLINGPQIHLPELRSMALGYDDPLSPVPFLHRVRLPSLEALSLHDFQRCREPETPGSGDFMYSLYIPGLQPMPLLITTLLATIASPHLLRSLRLIGVYDTSFHTNIFYRLGPHLRSLYLADCSDDFLPLLADAMLVNNPRWRLERLTVRGMDNDDLLKCLRIRHAQKYPPLKLLSLEPYIRPPPRETLERFAEVVNV